MATKERGWKIGLVVAIVATIAIVGLAADEAWWTSYVTTDSGLPADVQVMVLDALVSPEGEYAAYATYAAILEAYGDATPFTNIMASEARHIEALTKILDAYGVPYPEENPYLGTIEVPASLAAAAQAGVDAEIANVDLYERQLESVANFPDIYQVFVNLQSASLNQHLPAFERAATRYS